MLRLFFISLIFVVLVPVWADAEQSEQVDCEVRSQWKGREVRSFVPGSLACLECPNEGFWYDSEVEADIFARVNEVRSGAGLPALLLRPELLPAARIHSFDMAQEGFIEHEGPDGRRAGQRVAALDRTLIPGELRENVAGIGGQLDYADAGRILHQLLIDSDSHRDNILAPGPTHLAIGVVRAEQGAWVTQVFVQPYGAFASPVPLQIDPSTPQNFPAASLPGWNVAAIELVEGDGAIHTLPTDALRPGRDVRLLITGTRMLDETRRQSVKLNGPLVSIIKDAPF